jgi:PAS domain S-box-containing protein
VTAGERRTAVAKEFENGMHPVRSQWQFQTKRSWAPPITSNLTKPLAHSLQADHASDDFLVAMVDACVSNVAVLDESGNILYASKAWRLFQQGTVPAVGRFEMPPYYFESCKRLAASGFEEDAEVTLEDDLQQILFEGEREFHHEYCCRWLNEGRPFVMHAARLNLPGSTFRVLMTHEDIPRTREGLKHSKEHLTQLLEVTKVLAWEAEVEGQRFTHVSEQAFKMLGYAPSAWYEPNFLISHIHPDDRQRVLSAYLKHTRISEHFDLTFRLLGSDGRVCWILNLVSVTREDGAAKRMLGFMIDISERKRAEEALKFLGSRLIAAQEEERKRVARELHDDLNQRMAVLSIELEQLGQKNQKHNSLRKCLDKLQLQAQEISSDIHRLSYQLHPSKLDHLGLAAAVKSLCDELSLVQSGKLRIHFHQTGFPVGLPKDTTLCIFRIAQEVLRNCVKHSAAKSAQVMLAKTEHAIRLSISDNGCGFDTRSDLMEKGLGFISMQERLRLVGGAMNIFSQPRHGTRIDVSVPLNRESSTRDLKGGIL